jgi:hypothetical protein
MKIIEKESKSYYQCEECGHIYEREELANKCETWCKEHKSCNLEIVKESVNIENKTNLKQLLLGILIGGVFIFVLVNLKVTSIPAKFSKNSINENLVSQIVNQVLPPEGFKTRLVFGDVVKKMIDCGVIDLEKMKKLYNGKIPDYIQKAIEGNPEPIIINQETANYLLNLFWPLGLSNKTEFNKNIPFSEKDLPYLASTGGWWYCNHGSTLLGALELAASQGYNEYELYKLALQLNSFWFPQNYIETAIYFKVDVDYKFLKLF